MRVNLEESVWSKLLKILDEELVPVEEMSSETKSVTELILFGVKTQVADRVMKMLTNYLGETMEMPVSVPIDVSFEEKKERLMAESGGVPVKCSKLFRVFICEK